MNVDINSLINSSQAKEASISGSQDRIEARVARSQLDCTVASAIQAVHVSVGLGQQNFEHFLRIFLGGREVEGSQLTDRLRIHRRTVRYQQRGDRVTTIYWFTSSVISNYF